MRNIGNGHHSYGMAIERHVEVNSVNDGYLALAAAIINQAVMDYRFLRFESNKDSGLKKEQRKKAWLDAKEFLFTDRIKVFCQVFGIIDFINIKKVRNLAKGKYE